MQFEIYNFLKENKGRKFTNKQISEHLGINKKNISAGTRKLLKYKMIFGERKIKRTKMAATEWRLWA